MKKKRIYIIIVAAVAVIALLGSGFSLGWQFGISQSRTVKIEGAANIENQSTADFSLFWEAWDRVDQLSLNNGDTSNQEKVYGAISGLVDSLDDDYADFFQPADSQQFQETIQGSFGGIGAEIGIRDEQLTVVSPLKKSPAIRAGLRSGDWIVSINATSTETLSLNRAVQYIRGPIGEPVTLTVFREDWEEPKEIEIVRDNITIPTLEYEFLDNGIVHVEVFSFNSNTIPQFQDAVVSALTRGTRGMVLDLRNNPGGFLQTAVNLSGWMLPRGALVVSEEGRSGIVEEYRTRGNASLKDFPIVILVNKGSASASEIVAGALRDQRDIPLVGETTFGKGTVQRLIDLSDGSSLKVTVAHWVLPGGHIIEEQGLEPDYKVSFEGQVNGEGDDPQLEKAREVLKERIDNRGNTIFLLGE